MPVMVKAVLHASSPFISTNHTIDGVISPMPEGKNTGSERLKLLSQAPQLMPGGTAGPLIRKLCFFRALPHPQGIGCWGRKRNPGESRSKPHEQLKGACV